MVDVKNGSSVLFWSDSWNFGGSVEPLRTRFSRIFSYAINEKLSNWEVAHSASLQSLFHLSLSSEDRVEFDQVHYLLTNIQLSLEEKGVWIWTTNPSGIYSAKTYYMMVQQPISVNPILF